MTEKLDRKETVSLEELVMSQMWELQQALYNILERKGIVKKEEILNELKDIRKHDNK